MDQSSLNLEVLIHDLSARLTALKAILAEATGEPSSDFLLQGANHPSTERTSHLRTNEPRKAAEVLTLVSVELNMLEIWTQNLVGTFNRTYPLRPNRRAVDLPNLVEQVLSLFSRLAIQKGLSLILQCKDDIESVWIDPLLIRRALANVVDNAIKYSFAAISGRDRNVSLQVRRYSSKNEIVIAVQSYGIGVLPEEVGRIFEYQQRGALANDRFRQGTGIGLAETRRIVEAHGGRVRLTSRLVGEDSFLTEVFIILPRR